MKSFSVHTKIKNRDHSLRTGAGAGAGSKTRFGHIVAKATRKGVISDSARGSGTGAGSGIGAPNRPSIGYGWGLRQAAPGSSSVLSGSSSGTGAESAGRVLDLHRKRERKTGAGIIHVQATWQNTLYTLTDKEGNVLAQSSSGSCDLTGSRKRTPFAARLGSESIVRKMKQIRPRIRSLEVRLSGTGRGRRPALRTIRRARPKVTIKLLRDVTPVPHNGCRPPKRRRR